MRLRCTHFLFLALCLSVSFGPAHGEEAAAPVPQATAAIAIAPDLALEYSGTYRLAPGHEITLGPFDEFGGRLVYLDLATRDQRVLEPRSQTTFAAGTTTLSTTPLQTELQFQRNDAGKVHGLLWRPAGGAERFAAKVHPTRHLPVEFRNGDVVLRGRLSLPDRPGRHPAVVMVHGSGAATRNIGFFTTHYEALGIAVLSFDKRGAGESSGNWKAAAFDELAGDVLAAVALLKARDDIDATRIGLDGSSQGGWVGSMAAARSPDVAWLRVRVGSGVTVVENMLYEDIAAMRELGLDDAQTAEVVAFDRELYALAMAGEPRAGAEAIAAKFRDRPWFAKLYPDGFKTSDNGWAWLKANGGIDPATVLRNVRCPVIWFLGTSDGNVPTARSLPRIAQALLEAGNSDFALHVVPSDHSFLADLPPDGNKAAVRRYVSGVFEASAAWLQARGFTGPTATPTDSD